MTDETKLVIVLEAQAAKLQRSLVETNRQIDRFARQTEQRFAQMQSKSNASFDRLTGQIRGSLGGLNNVLAPLAGALGTREIIAYADAWAEAQNKVNSAATTAGTLARPLEQIKDAANGARTDLAEYVDLYARLLRISPGVAATEEDVARATDAVAKSLKAGGASAQEQAAALIQLGQALGSGNLQGDELRSIRENAPLIAKAIADEFGVTIGELKKLGAEGKLTSDRVFKAILAGAGDIEKAFGSTTSTISDAFKRINNELTAYIGTAGQSTGATKGLIDALNYLADNFKEVADIALNFIAIIAGALAGRAVVGFVVGIGQAVAALAAFMTALRAGTLTAAAFSASLGPIGLLAGAAAAAIILLSNAQDEASSTAKKYNSDLAENAAHLQTASDASYEYRKALRDQIEMQVKAAEAALTEADAQTRAARIKAAAARFNILGVTIGNAFDEAAVNAATDKSKVLDKALQDLEAQLAAADALLKDSTPSKPTLGGGAGGDADKWQSEIDKINQRTKALEATTAAQAGLNPLVNDYGYATEKVKIQQELLNAAEAAQIPITADLRATIDILADGYAQASVEAAKLAESQEYIRESVQEWFDVAKSAVRGFITDLEQGKSAAEALGNVFQKLADKFLDLGLNVLFGGGAGGGFGLVGKLFGFADGGIAAHGRPVPLKRFAGGGVSNTAAIFGEAGAEAAVPLPDGRRIPVDLRQPSASGGGVGSGGTVQLNISMEVQNGNLVPLIAQVSGDVAGQKVQQMGPAIVNTYAPAAVAKAQRNRAV